MSELVDRSQDADVLLRQGGELLAALIGEDDWLPEAFARPDPVRYQQYLLHCDPRERFSLVSFVWGPGQGTPVHDHRVWGLVGVLRGAERVEAFTRRAGGSLQANGPAVVLRAGEVEAIHPDRNDIHRVANAVADAPSISIHLYGGNIGTVERASYGPDGVPRPFISGYANTLLPNLWFRPVAS